MKTETTYYPYELESGECSCCSQQSDEILIDDGRCLDCIEEEKFIDTCEKQFNALN